MTAGGLIGTLRAMLTLRSVLLGALLYVTFTSRQPPWYVPVQVAACLLLAYVLLCAGRIIRGRAAARLHRAPGRIHATRRR